ncbi:hypothetical protein V5F59_10160 [Xanthobacter autotrophicus DSM 431]|uniref:hypothetical protein n=1 Tax=Xanthobacter nonsaccharivorans TaxID=3119912 RepID=UPI003728A7AD
MPPRSSPPPQLLFTHADVSRAIKAATAAGVKVLRIEIEPAKISIVAADARVPLPEL